MINPAAEVHAEPCARPAMRGNRLFVEFHGLNGSPDILAFFADMRLLLLLGCEIKRLCLVF
jgi:hypothetical protein